MLWELMRLGGISEPLTTSPVYIVPMRQTPLVGRGDSIFEKRFSETEKKKRNKKRKIKRTFKTRRNQATEEGIYVPHGFSISAWLIVVSKEVDNGCSSCHPYRYQMQRNQMTAKKLSLEWRRHFVKVII